MQQDSFTTADGTNIVFRFWHAKSPLERVIILLHRGHEHSGRMTEIAEFYCQRGYHVYAWDARGNGLSEGERDAAESISLLAQDLQQFVTLVTEKTNINSDQMVVMASSMGAVIAATWLHAHAPNIRGVILATAAFNIRLYVPFAASLLKIARYFGWMPRVTSYVKSKVLTHDRKQQKIYNADPLISSGISTDLLLDTLSTGSRLIVDAGAIEHPILMLSAGKDWVVCNESQRNFYNRLSSTWKEWRYYPDSYHALFHEDSRETVFHDCLDFIERVFKQQPNKKSYLQAHKSSYTRDNYDQLQLPSINPLYPITRILMRTLGQYSYGIKLGLETGFDSGQTLDYIYENQPNGNNILGRGIDKIYLNSAGWSGIRRRKALIDSLLEQQLANLEYRGKILDIAAGNGRYLLHPLQNYPNISAQLRDYDKDNVQLMIQQVEEHQLQQRVTVIQADAFNSNSYQQEQEFDLVIISGLFELFSDNELICTALKGVAKQLKARGILIYTNQPWHPQQEFIARTLDNHQGTAWQMRCRTQAEMDQLVTHCGFSKISTQIEPTGIFSVSVAQKQD